MKIEIASLSIEFLLPKFLENELSHFYKDFYTDNESNIKIIVEKVNNLLCGQKTIKIENEENKLKVIRCDIFCEIENNNGIAKITFSQSFDALLRVLYSIFLLNNDTILLHSCGMGNGLIFSGPDGSGKTTLANEFGAINDEIMAINEEFMFGTPFSTNFKKNAMKKIEKIYFLGERDEKLSKIDAFALLLTNTIFFNNDKKNIKKLLSIAYKIVNNIKCEKITIDSAKYLISNYFRIKS